MTRHLLHLSFLALCCLFFSGNAFADRGSVVKGDYDADGRSDIIVTRKVAGFWHWYFRLATGVEIGPVSFGLEADTILPGDFDGDGDFNLNVIRDIAGFLNWFSLNNDGTTTQTVWGLSGDTPLTGFFGGSGENDRVVVRETATEMIWYIENQAPAGISWGLPGDAPFVADMTGDGIDELIVSRSVGGELFWFARELSGTALAPISWGLDGDQTLVPADFNGDGKADLVVTRTLGGFKHFFLRYTDLNLGQTILFGLESDTAYIGNFTQSSLAEFAVYRTSQSTSNHFVRFAQQNLIVNVPFGLSTDTLVLPEGGVAEIDNSVPGCSPSPGTATDFLDGAGGGALWKPHSEGVSNGAPVVLLPINYCGSPLAILGADGTVVSGIQRTKCGGNGNRAHFWIAKTAGQLAPFAPLTVAIVNDGLTECRSVPNPFVRYD